MKQSIHFFIPFICLVFLYACINPPRDVRCIAQDQVESLTLYRSDGNNFLSNNDEIVLPMHEGEEESLLMEVKIRNSYDNVKNVCTVIRDKDLLGNPVIATNLIPIAAGETSTREPLQVVKFTCQNQKVWAGDGDNFTPTGEKKTKIFVQAVTSLSNLPTTLGGGVQSVRIKVKCPDVTISD